MGPGPRFPGQPCLLSGRLEPSYLADQMPRLLNLRVVLAAAFLSLQGLAIVQQHLGPTRYFAWAPNDYIVQYEIRVDMGDRFLTGAQISARYRQLYGTSAGSSGALALSGVYEAPPQQLIDELQQYERTYGRSDHARVTLIYTQDGNRPQTWTYSP